MLFEFDLQQLSLRLVEKAAGYHNVEIRKPLQAGASMTST
jgi:hypothetical protein